jgi:hypothetical protein
VPVYPKVHWQAPVFVLHTAPFKQANWPPAAQPRKVPQYVPVYPVEHWQAPVFVLHTAPFKQANWPPAAQPRTSISKIVWIIILVIIFRSFKNSVNWFLILN